MLSFLVLMFNKHTEVIFDALCWLPNSVVENRAIAIIIKQIHVYTEFYDRKPMKPASDNERFTKWGSLHKKGLVLSFSIQQKSFFDQHGSPAFTNNKRSLNERQQRHGTSPRHHIHWPWNQVLNWNILSFRNVTNIRQRLQFPCRNNYPQRSRNRDAIRFALRGTQCSLSTFTVKQLNAIIWKD